MRDLLELVQDRESARTEEEFNSATVQIIGAVLAMTFTPKEVARPAWVQIIEHVLADICSGAFDHPFKFDQEDGQEVLFIRTSDIMDHLLRGTWLREQWDQMPIKSDRGLKKWLNMAGVLLVGPAGSTRPFERTLCGRRVGHLVAIRLAELRMAGIQTFPASQIVCQTTKP